MNRKKSPLFSSICQRFSVFFHSKFQKATSGYNKVLGDSLRLNPHLLFRDYNEATENVLHKDAVYVRVS